MEYPMQNYAQGYDPYSKYKKKLCDKSAEDCNIIVNNALRYDIKQL